jgi:hypothetical protein
MLCHMSGVLIQKEHVGVAPNVGTVSLGLCVISVVPVHRVGPEAARADPIRRPLRRNLFRRQQAEVVDGHRSHRKSVTHLPGTFPFPV